VQHDLADTQDVRPASCVCCLKTGHLNGTKEPV